MFYNFQLPTAYPFNSNAPAPRGIRSYIESNTTKTNTTHKDQKADKDGPINSKKNPVPQSVNLF